VHQAIDAESPSSTTAEYNRGKSEDWLGKGLRGIVSVFLMNQGLHPWADASLQADAGAELAPFADGLSRSLAVHASASRTIRLFIRPGGAAELAQANVMAK